MIARRHRFHGHGSLRYVYQHGRSVRGSLSSLKFVANDRRDSYRLAVVVSKKVSKSAIVRNKIRRRIYEAVRRHEAEIKGAPDMVITVFSDQIAEAPADEVEKLVFDHLSQAKLV